MVHFRHIVAVAVAVAFVPLTARAETGGPIYVCFDAAGQRTVTNVRTAMKGLKCERQADAPLPVTPGTRLPAKGPGSASPADFPKVDASTQKARDDMRHKVLAEELVNEQKLLAKATQELGDARTPRVGEDKSSVKYLERINEAEKEQQRHRQNVESIQREIDTRK
jgi:hypothetical protein